MPSFQNKIKTLTNSKTKKLLNRTKNTNVSGVALVDTTITTDLKLKLNSLKLGTNSSTFAKKTKIEFTHEITELGLARIIGVTWTNQT